MYLDELIAKKEITPDTARTYKSCIKQLKNSCSSLSAESFKEYMLKNVKDKGGLLKFVSALRKYEIGILKQEKGILFGEPEVELFKAFKEAPTNNKKLILKNSNDRIERKINGLRNKKLKIALRLQLRSGLRVAEIAEIRKNDLLFDDEKIKIEVRDGKGRKSREVEVLNDAYLLENLVEQVETLKSNDKVFYSRDYLRHKAAAIGIETHDLRRINAKNRLEEEIDMGKSTEEAKDLVRKQLGHETIRMTNLYLRYKYK